jgi:hypothetical protein
MSPQSSFVFGGGGAVDDDGVEEEHDDNPMTARQLAANTMAREYSAPLVILEPV